MQSVASGAGDTFETSPEMEAQPETHRSHQAGGIVVTLGRADKAAEDPRAPAGQADATAASSLLGSGNSCPRSEEQERLGPGQRGVGRSWRKPAQADGAIFGWVRWEGRGPDTWRMRPGDPGDSNLGPGRSGHTQPPPSLRSQLGSWTPQPSLCPFSRERLSPSVSPACVCHTRPWHGWLPPPSWAEGLRSHLLHEVFPSAGQFQLRTHECKPVRQGLKEKSFEANLVPGMIVYGWNFSTLGG